MTEQQITEVLLDIEDVFRRGYGVGYVDGFSKAKNPLYQEKETSTSIIKYIKQQLEEKYKDL
jgi:hypothetical protein